MKINEIILNEGVTDPIAMQALSRIKQYAKEHGLPTGLSFNPAKVKKYAEAHGDQKILQDFEVFEHHGKLTRRTMLKGLGAVGAGITGIAGLGIGLGHYDAKHPSIPKPKPYTIDDISIGERSSTVEAKLGKPKHRSTGRSSDLVISMWYYKDGVIIFENDRVSNVHTDSVNEEQVEEDATPDAINDIVRLSRDKR